MVSRPPCVLGLADRDDVPALVALERACFSHPWTLPQMEEAVGDHQGGGVLILRAPITTPWDGLVAYGIYRVAADEVSIHTVAVAPEWRRLGIARWILERILELAAKRGATIAFLEARQSNEAALHLYRSLGFAVVATRRGYYTQPREDALLLRRSIGPPAPGSAVP